MKPFNSKLIFDLLGPNSSQVLDSPEQIEDVMVVLNSLDRKEDFYKRLKVKRAKQIDNELARLSSQRNKLRDLIDAELDRSGFKTLSFPGIGKVSKRIKKGRWVIVDEEALIDKFEQELDPEQTDELIKQSKKIVKKNADKVFDAWAKTDDVPDFVTREEDGMSLSLTYDKAIGDLYEEVDSVEDVDSNSMEDMDSLEV